MLITSEHDPRGRYTRILLESYYWSDSRTVDVGERLTKHEKVGDWQCKVIPDEWVVVEVERFDPSERSREFTDVVLAYCERQPLSPQEVEERSYVVEVKRPALV
ncbi:MAG: hypothetical protein ACFCBU_10150 [Cyanophyceae cyanobacterium]